MVVESLQVKDGLEMINYLRPAKDTLFKHVSHSCKIEETYILTKLKPNDPTNCP